MRVFIYFNLHRKCFSVKALEGPMKGRVVSHTSSFTLTDAAFKVSEAGRQRVLREQRKNVHAGVVGNLTDNMDIADSNAVRVSYNPYKASSFFDVATGNPVMSAKIVCGNGRQLFAI